MCVYMLKHVCVRVIVYSGQAVDLWCQKYFVCEPLEWLVSIRQPSLVKPNSPSHLLSILPTLLFSLSALLSSALVPLSGFSFLSPVVVIFFHYGWKGLSPYLSLCL